VLVIGFTEYRHLQAQQSEILADGRRKATLITEIIKNGITTMMVGERHDDLQDFLETLVSSEMGAVRILRLDGTVIGSSEASEIGSVRETGESDAIELGDPPVHSIQLPLTCRPAKPSRGCRIRRKRP
jgi:hypothetical protein